MADVSIASAVTIPDDPAPAHVPSTNSLKRRQSDVAEQEQESKRQRISPGKNSPTAERDDANSRDSTASNQPPENPGAESREPRRKSSVADEKQRSKRLFGALLGSLNQPSDRTSKRRQEIESRRKAELQRQDDDRVEDKLRRQERLAEQRKKAQVKVDEQNMRTRHSNMLNTANFLQTVAEPRIYYKPWDLRPDEEDRIEQQVKEARALINKELEEIDSRHDRPSTREPRIDSTAPAASDESKTDALPDIAAEESKIDESNGPPSGNIADAEEIAPAKSANIEEEEDSKPAEVPDSDATNPDADNLPSKSEELTEQESKAEKVEAVEDEGDHVVDGDEDTVIY